MSTHRSITLTPGMGHNGRAKTQAERQKEHYHRRKAEGWRKTWVDPQTLTLADELGGIERIQAHRDKLVQLIRAQDEALAILGAELEEMNSRSWISRLLNRKR
ncbi:hypothetical protein [Puniceibacterium sediminis]|uniref:Uncharacterized protein n=1 Tax=Puniceibacterium sediminis TaxID=1608407 RepID=A0A238ZZ66_9RHOB|nr:hypothetical protein [Puniceibacterium sediminis]SNR88148.1 hypothetical protein SAMN06265370_1492 [Puniceibacterium sediminis]